mmetsp:Transcript_120114/g.347014  ORF Transcript_120114/g.347014 Transcript_120114/m.347014 type:complete len:215 (-) Transcript_120114:21-665(-)
MNTSHVHKLLSGGRGNQSSTTRGRDQSDTNGTTFPGDLARDSVRKSGNTSPISSSDRGDVELGSSDGTTDGSGDFGRALNTQTDVSVSVSDGNEGLESGSLTSRRLLLNRHDLHNLILKLVLQEIVDNFGLLNRDGEKEDFLDGSNLSFLNKASELGDGNPNVLVSSSATSTASASTSASSSATTASKTSSSSFFSHCQISSKTNIARHRDRVR